MQRHKKNLIRNVHPGRKAARPERLRKRRTAEAREFVAPVQEAQTEIDVE